MKHYALLAIAAALLCGSGCGKKNTKSDEEVVETTVSDEEEAPNSDGTKVAEGEERETLLALQRVHFSVDKADLNEESKTALQRAVEGLKTLPKVHLYVDGHADETGTTEYNLQLGEKRAKAVRDFLTRSGIAADRLHIVSFGEEKPLKEGSSSDDLAANRRVEFRLMRGEIEIVLEPGVPAI